MTRGSGRQRLFPHADHPHQRRLGGIERRGARLPRRQLLRRRGRRGLSALAPTSPAAADLPRRAVATTGVLSSTMPTRRPWPSSAAPPESRAAAQALTVSPLSLCRHGRDRAAAALALRIGDAEKREVGTFDSLAQTSRARDRARHRSRSSARSAALSSAWRSASPYPLTTITLQPSVSCRSVRMWPAVLTTMPVPYSTLRLGIGPTMRDAGDAGKWRERTRHHHHDRIHDGLGRLIVEDGHAAHLAVPDLGADVEFLQALHARQDEEIAAQEIDLELAGRRFFLLLLVDRRKRRAGLPDLEGLDLDLALRRRPASAVLALTLVGDLLGRKPDARAGDGSSTMLQPTCACLAFADGCQEGAFLRVEDAGFLELAIVLERLDGGRGLVVDLAIDQAVVIAGPGEIELEGEAVGQRRGGVARRSGRGRRTFSRGRGCQRRVARVRFRLSRRALRASAPPVSPLAARLRNIVVWAPAGSAARRRTRTAPTARMVTPARQSFAGPNLAEALIFANAHLVCAVEGSEGVVAKPSRFRE